MNKTTKLRPRKRYRREEKPPVFRVPEELSDLVYLNFNTMAHGAKLSDGTAVLAWRMIREEHFSKKELIELRDVIDGEEETSELSGELLGGRETLQWIESILHPAKN